MTISTKKIAALFWTGVRLKFFRLSFSYTMVVALNMEKTDLRMIITVPEKAEANPRHYFYLYVQLTESNFRS